MSVEDYLASEPLSEHKREYQAGEVFAMAGASQVHVRITMNGSCALLSHLRGRKCRPYAALMKVRVASVDAFYYPDLLVTCDPRDRQERYFVRHPKVIIEVLSPSTEGYDRGAKFFNYQTLESLEEYVLISQDRMRVERYHREGPNRWSLEFLKEGDVLRLESLDFEMPVIDLYEDVDFALPEAADSSEEAALAGAARSAPSEASPAQG